MSIKAGTAGFFGPSVRDTTAPICGAAPVCGGGDFYLRKDFDPKVGLAVVITGATVSFRSRTGRRPAATG